MPSWLLTVVTGVLFTIAALLLLEEEKIGRGSVFEPGLTAGSFYGRF